MTNEQLVRLILQLHEEMKPLILKAGIQEEKYLSVLRVIDEPEFSELMEVHTWLTEIRFDLYDNVLKVWERHPADVWANYDIMGVTELAEQKLLRKQMRLLRIAINGSGYVKETSKSAKQDEPEKGSSQVHFRSSEAGTDEGSG
jgi:hypothetical protein